MPKQRPRANADRMYDYDFTAWHLLTFSCGIKSEACLLGRLEAGNLS